MPPVANRYNRRYHPFSRPLSLHTLFPVERPISLPHSLYTVYPTDSDVSSVDSPQPLTLKAVVLTAAEYFTMQEKQYPNKVYEKPKGDVGRTDPKRGYSLGAALKWPTEVYKEVQTKLHQLASENLPVASFGNQTHENLDAFYPKVHDTYPYLRNYEANWVIADFLRMYLKNKVHAPKSK